MAAAVVPLLITGVAAPAAAATPVAAKAKPSPSAGPESRAMGAVAMRARGTRYSPDRAAMRLEKWAKRGVRGYHNQCLRLADNAYQPKGNRTSTALSQWKRAKKKGFAHSKDRRPQVGAQMFWRTSNPAGHIATYVGNGKAVTNMPGGRVKKVNWKVMNSWGPYLGWAEPYYG
jgi:hypothetical protein